MFGMENFGANFRVPGIVTVGPNFRIFGALEGQVSLSGHLEAQVKIAEWNIQQAYPESSANANPSAVDNSLPSYDDTKTVGQPQLNASVAAEGYITAHLKPRLTFGIEFGKSLQNMPSKARENLI
jgi:chitinase